jgi:hypothetical protein
VTPVTGEEVIAHVRYAFASGPPTTADLLDAVRSGARPVVIEMLRRIPERRFDAPDELMSALSDVRTYCEPS